MFLILRSQHRLPLSFGLSIYFRSRVHYDLRKGIIMVPYSAALRSRNPGWPNREQMEGDVDN